MGDISKNFSYYEFVRTSYVQYRDANLRLSEHPAIKRNITSLVNEILQPIRDEFNTSILITSGIRCYSLNHEVGGSPISQHLVGEAADFIVKNLPLLEVFEFIKKSCLAKRIMTIGQCILYEDKIHISLPKVEEDYNEFMVQFKNPDTGKTFYSKVV